MKDPKNTTLKRQTSKPSFKTGSDARTGVDRLYCRSGVRKTTFWYKYPNGEREILSTAETGDRNAIAQAQIIAKRRALDLQAGKIMVGTVGELIQRFKEEKDADHYADQSKHGKSVREGAYRNLTKFFGKMSPRGIKKFHGYQYLDARAKAGAPMIANKELALMSTIFGYAERWGTIDANPFVGMQQNTAERNVRVVMRAQIVRFYLWSLRQDQAYRTMGCAAMFCYLTGFRAAEIRPFHLSGVRDEGVTVINAKRKKGENVVEKMRTWSPRLRAVVARSRTGKKTSSLFLFPNGRGQAYSKSGWGSVWSDAMFSWIGSRDPAIAALFLARKAREASKRRSGTTGDDLENVTSHPDYFSLSDIRPAAITQKLASRSIDAYDFAAHANPATTHKSYDRRKVKTASPTE